MATEPAPKQRDLTLDIAKGLAIMLVIAGHICQNSRDDFDDFLPFRVIYAFHMPLFIFVSGMVVALRLPAATNPALGFNDYSKSALRSVGHSGLRLLVPFATWTIIGWAINRRHEMSLPDWLLTVGRNPDNSLWFLLAVFYCHLLWQFWHWLMGIISKQLNKMALHSAAVFVQNEKFSLPLSLAFLWAPSLLMTSQYGIGYIKLYFLYFIAGAGYQLFLRQKMKPYYFLLAALVYVLLVPFWYRLHPSEPLLWLGPFIHARHLADLMFRVVVAGGGIIAMLGISAYLARLPYDRAKQALAYCGVASLGIYAVHFYLVDLRPLFIAPLAVSLAFYWIVSRIPVARLLLLGERAKT